MNRGPCIDVLHEKTNKDEHVPEKNTCRLKGAGMLSFWSKVKDEDRTMVDEW